MIVEVRLPQPSTLRRIEPMRAPTFSHIPVDARLVPGDGVPVDQEELLFRDRPGQKHRSTCCETDQPRGSGCCAGISA